MESPSIECDSHVAERAATLELVPEYGGARETPLESGRTIFQG